MLFVEQGKVDLDAPVTDYLADFQPMNKSGKKITLRQALDGFRQTRVGRTKYPPTGGFATRPAGGR